MRWLKRLFQPRSRMVKAEPCAQQVRKTFLDLVAQRDTASLEMLNNLLPQLGLKEWNLEQIMPLAERINCWYHNNEKIDPQHQKFVDAFVAHIHPKNYMCLFWDSLQYDSRMFAQAIAPHLQANQIDNAWMVADLISRLRDDKVVAWWFKLMTPYVEFHRIAAYLIWRECTSTFDILEQQTHLDPGRILTIMMDNGMGAQGQLFERVLHQFNLQQKARLADEIEVTPQTAKARKM